KTGRSSWERWTEALPGTFTDNRCGTGLESPVSHRDHEIACERVQRVESYETHITLVAATAVVALVSVCARGHGPNSIPSPGCPDPGHSRSDGPGPYHGARICRAGAGGRSRQPGVQH